jgi:hypothetical protein
MTTELIIFLGFILIREIMHYRQVNKLQEMLKTNDLREYYSVKKDKKNSNKLNSEEEPNKIAFDDPELDLSKVNKAIVDGEEKPIQIL